MGAFIRKLALIAALVAMPAAAFAQDAALSGTIKDTTGGALPGVTVTATNQDSGNTFTAVTAIKAVPIGSSCASARTDRGELPASSHQPPGLELKVGEDAVVNLQMTPATVEESVRHRRSAASRSQPVARRQHRPETDAGAAAQWPQLARSDTARAGQPRQRRQRQRQRRSAAARQRHLSVERGRQQFSTPARSASASRTSAAMRSPSSSTCRTASMRRRAARAASRSTR